MEQVAFMKQEYLRQKSERDQLIEACQSGDREAFRMLFEQHKDKVYAIALHFSGNDATAHDISQQVFLKLFHSIQQFRFHSEFSTWLYRLVVNACYDEQRRWRKFLPFTQDIAQVPEPALNLERNYSRQQLSHTVHLAIATLSPKLRMPILLKYIEGLSYEEIAAILNCSAGTVASRLNRGHKALAQKLGHLRHSLSQYEKAEE